MMKIKSERKFEPLSVHRRGSYKVELSKLGTKTDERLLLNVSINNKVYIINRPVAVFYVLK